MNNVILHTLETNSFIGVLLNFFILLVFPAICIYGLFKSIKRKNKITTIIFSSLIVCFLLLILHLVITLCLISNRKNLFMTDLDRPHHYTINEIEQEIIFITNNNDFPIIKINDGIYIGGQYGNSFKFYNKPDYKIKAFVFYIGMSEVPINYDFIPGHSYEINFDKILEAYQIKDIGVFYSKNNKPEKYEIWTDEMEDGINCLFSK